MSKQHDAITLPLRDWLARQKVFFVATAPLADDGLVNCSPKGMDTFRVLGPAEVAYLDLTGSGIETVAHLRENGRIVLMFCAFEGPPKIVRLHGRGEVVWPGSAVFDELKPLFPDVPGERSVIRVRVSRVSDSCGWGVPLYDYAGERSKLIDYAVKNGPAGMAAYRAKKNARSLDGLPGLESA